MQAVILAGGAGSRLRPVLCDRPKPMAEFGAKPFLEHQIEFLREHRVSDVVLCVGYRHEQIESWFADGGRWNLRIRYSVESAPLGTGGALRLARPLLQETFLLLNGDSFLQTNLTDFLEFHRRKVRTDGSCLGTLALVGVPDASAYGAVEIDAGQRIVAYAEKTRSASPWINAGVYALQAALLDGVPAGRALSLERDVLPAALHRGHLYGAPVDGFFVDIGTPHGYHVFKQHIEGSRHDHPQ
jgi:D-glycero-alpha-D-manno-heptose 1-phosphate guanylyltransferase